ncbi:MAG: sporulation protein, partial [Thermus sp.]
AASPRGQEVAPPAVSQGAKTPPAPSSSETEPVVTVLPLPQAPAPPASEEARRGASEPPRPSPGSAAAPSSSPPQEGGKGVWRVAVGSFTNPENALRLSQELSARGFKVRLEAAGSYTRVVVGPYPSEEEARKAAQALSGYAPRVYRGEAPLPSAYFQVGAFQKEENALALASKLKEAGIPVVVRKDGLFRVQVGPVSEAEKARVRARLEGMGLTPMEAR